MSAVAARQFNWQPVLIGAVCIVALLLAGLLVKSLIGGTSGPVKKPPKISLIPTTPPPPPPPKEEKKPEPPKETKTMNEPPKEPQPQQPPDQQLKMEGAAGDGPSAFASGTVKNDYIGQPTGGGGRLQFGLYSMQLQSYLQDILGKSAGLRTRSYHASIRLWLDRDGGLQRFDIDGSSGDPTVDDALRKALANLARVREAPPADMAQPIRIRVSNRPLG